MDQKQQEVAMYIESLIKRARVAQKVGEGYGQEKVDELTAAINLFLILYKDR